MTARRALLESDAAFPYDAAPRATARRALISEVADADVLTTVCAKPRRAIDAAVRFERDEPVAMTLSLPRAIASGKASAYGAGRSLRVRRSLLAAAATATIGAALVGPSALSMVAAQDPGASAAATSRVSDVSRSGGRVALATPGVQALADQEAGALASASAQALSVRSAVQQKAASDAAAQAAAQKAAADAAAQKAAADAAAQKAAADAAAQAAAAAAQAKAQAAQQAAQQASQQPPASAAPQVTGSTTGSVTASDAAAGAVSYALAQVGKPYSWGASGPSAYDCSGLMVAAYSSVGISLPRTSQEQASAGYAVSFSDLRAGDLIVTNGGSHVVMYIGNGKTVEAADYGVGVVVRSVGSQSIYAMRRVA